MDNLRRAIVLFTAIMLIVAAVTGFMLALHFHNTSSTDVRPIDYSGSKYSPSETSSPVQYKSITSANILFIVGKKEIKSSEVLAVVNFDGNDKNVSIMYIPKDTRYTYAEGASATVTQCGEIGDCYKLNGGALTSQIVASILGIKIQRYVYLDFEELSSLINHFSSRESGILFEMPLRISKPSPYGTVLLNQGMQYFDGMKTSEVFMYSGVGEASYTQEMIDYFDGGEDGRIRIASSLIDQFVLQKFINPATDYYRNNFETLLKSALNGVDTDITDIDIAAYYHTENKYTAVASYKIVCEERGSYGHYYINRIMDASVSYTSNAYSESTSSEMIKEHFDTAF